MTLSHIGCGLALLTLGGLCDVAYAQDAAPGAIPESAADEQGPNLISYPNAFFTDTQPNNALDMVRRTPGFAYNGGRGDVRGLSGASGNVLVDGQPQTSKSVGLDEVLSRIPASQVLRIDVVRGGEGGISMLGFPVVANVIRRAGAESQTTAQIETKVYGDSDLVDLNGRLEWSRRRGDLSFAGAAEVRKGRADDATDGLLIRRNAAGATLDSGLYLSDYRDKSAEANATVEYTAGRTLYRANIGLDHRENNRDELAGFSIPERFLSVGTSDDIEVGGNIEREMSQWLKLRLDGLQTLEKDTRTAGRVGRQSSSENTAGESILRISAEVNRWTSLKLESGVEGAFNYLDQTSTQTSANANVRVEERRAQPYITANWKVFEPLSLEFGARYETSTISQEGDTNSERTFNFLKPRLIAVFAATSKTDLRFRIERDVKQLDFGDFVASSGQSDNQATAGNADLQPERAWVYEAVLEQRLWERSALLFTYTHESIEELLDNIPVGPTSEGRGNVDAGTRDTLALDMKVALDPLGVRGGRLEVLPTYYISDTTDPFTRQPRDISGSQQWRGRINFFLDRPEYGLTYGLESFIGFRERTWRRDQVSTTVQPFNYTTWVEWRPRMSTQLRASIQTLGMRERNRVREVYAGARPVAPLSFVESRVTKRDASFQFRVRQTF
jgi:TonB dependent receptor/TonB-dependent Receptor Plug Domain